MKNIAQEVLKFKTEISTKKISSHLQSKNIAVQFFLRSEIGLHLNTL